MAHNLDTDRTTRLLELMKQGDDAFNRRDLERMSAAHEEHLICHMMGTAAPIRGDKAHREAMQGMMRSFPDVRVSDDPYPILFGQGDWTTVVSRVTGTFTGEMKALDGKTIPPTGEAFDLDMTTVAPWNSDVITEEWVFWDSALMQQQIGLAE